MQGVQIIFFSPLFKKKDSNKPLGLYRYNLLANLTKLPNIALGGINKINLKLLKTYKCEWICIYKLFQILN